MYASVHDAVFTWTNEFLVEREFYRLGLFLFDDLLPPINKVQEPNVPSKVIC